MRYENIKPYVSSDGFWAIPKTSCKVGVVLVLRCGQSVTLIQKQVKKGYEFSNMLSLPGGMVRPALDEKFEDSILSSLAQRAKSETGVDFGYLKDICIQKNAPLPVTSYTVKEKTKYTVIIPISANISKRIELSSVDTSVKNPRWHKIDTILWDKLSPASFVILNHFVKIWLGKFMIDTSSLLKKHSRMCHNWEDNAADKD